MPEFKVILRGREKLWSKKVKSRSGKVEDIVLKAGINPLEVLIKLNGEFVPDTAKARNGDKLELLQITSRG